MDDIGREFRGLDAIKAWSDREIFDVQVTLEVIDSANDGNTAVDGWIWTVYHRMPFMDARLLDTGVGLEGMHAVMDFGTLLSAKLGSRTSPKVTPIARRWN